MAIVVDRWNSVYIGGQKGRKFEVRFCPQCVNAPWSIHSRRSNGYYFATLREVLCFAAGRGYIEPHLIGQYQSEIGTALDRKWDERNDEAPKWG